MPDRRRARTMAFEIFARDVLDPHFRANLWRGSAHDVYEQMRLAEMLEAVVTGVEYRFFDPHAALAWASRTEASFHELLLPEARLAQAGLPPPPILQEGAFEEALATAQSHDAHIDLPTFAAFQSKLYGIVVHTHGRMTQGLLSITMFGSLNEWRELVSRVRDAIERATTHDDKLRMAAALPRWLMDGPAARRTALRYVAEDVLRIPLETEFDLLVEAMVARQFGGRREGTKVIERMFGSVIEHPQTLNRAEALTFEALDRDPEWPEHLVDPAEVRTRVRLIIETAARRRAMPLLAITPMVMRSDAIEPWPVRLLGHAWWRLVLGPTSSRARIREIERLTEPLRSAVFTEVGLEQRRVQGPGGPRPRSAPEEPRTERSTWSPKD